MRREDPEAMAWEIRDLRLEMADAERRLADQIDKNQMLQWANEGLRAENLRLLREAVRQPWLSKEQIDAEMTRLFRAGLGRQQ